MHYPPRPEELERMSGRDLAECFLIRDLFPSGALRMRAAGLDRMVVGATVSSGELRLPPCEEFGTRYFTERRELGIVNIGEPGEVRVGNRTFPLGKLDFRKYIYPQGIRSCQLTMGYTELAAGNVWNTMPAHTHGRRSEVYLYFDLDDGFVVHFLGRPDNTRHLMVRDRQAVLSPPWSVHFGAGDRMYRLIWGMVGENQDFEDMEVVDNRDLR